MCVRFAAALLLAACGAAGARSLEARARGIINRQCTSCHGPQRRFANLDLTTPAALRDVVVPGKPDDSLMLQLIEAGKMPAGGRHLRPAEVNVLRQWIAAGAPVTGARVD